MAGAIRNFSHGLLHSVFAKESETAIGRLSNDFAGKLFANGYQLHFLRRPPCPFARSGNALLHLGNVFGDGLHTWSLACGRYGE